jgi:hypothetical protein
VLFPDVPEWRLTAEQVHWHNDAQLAFKLGKTLAEIDAMPAQHVAILLEVSAFNDFLDGRKERQHWDILRKLFGRRR